MTDEIHRLRASLILANAEADRMRRTLTRLHIALQTAKLFRGYPETGPLHEPATDAALRASDALLNGRDDGSEPQQDRSAS